MLSSNNENELINPFYHFFPNGTFTPSWFSFEKKTYCFSLSLDQFFEQYPEKEKMS
jgi:hypothetical protein